MEYLDQQLRRRKKNQQVTDEKSFGFGKLLIGLGVCHFGVFLVRMFRVRKDIVSKTMITKEFYKNWFPLYFFGIVVYPIDGVVWGSVSGQIGFWQRVVFEDVEKEETVIEG